MLLLLILQFSGHVQPWDKPGAAVFFILWALFVLEFVLKVALSPDKRAYLSANAQNVVFVILPVLAVVRLVDAGRRLLIALIHLLLPTSPEAGPYIAALKRRGLGKLALISTLVILIGATLWWSAATATTVPNQLYPVTVAGEVVGFLMMVYAVCVFGYLASSLASVFIAGDAQQGDTNRTEANESGGDTAVNEALAANADGTFRLSQREIEVLRSILTRLERE